MARTTAPRPFDIAEVFPELREHRGTATRLHPRTGTPTIADSSIGGPLLWPADEPWPMCTDGDAHDIEVLLTPATVYHGREIYAAADIGRPLATAPEPAVVEENHLPNPCVVHPEQVADYRYRELPPKGTPGPDRRLTGPFRRNCRTCDAEMTLLFTVGSGEWDEAGNWRPIEDPVDTVDPMTGVVINRGFDWYVFHCPVSFDHPFATEMQ
jgi:hypothetical protein